MSITHQISQLTVENISEAVADSYTWIEVCTKLGFKCNFHTRPKIRDRALLLNISTAHFKKTRLYTNDDLIKATKSSDSYSGICNLLGITVCTYNFKSIQDSHKVLHISFEPGGGKLQSTRIDIKDILLVIDKCLCILDICRFLKISPHSNNYAKINELIKHHNVDISHFDAYLANRRNKKQWLPEQIFVEHCVAHRGQVRDMMKKHHYTGICSDCGCGETYNNKPLKLELDHINGNSTDNRLQNLRWLCPNCHSQTPTYRRGGKKQLDS